MGVMSCSRSGCKHIMCDTYIPSVGYICGDCQADFKKHLIVKRRSPANENQLLESLERFIKSDTNYAQDVSGVDVDYFFKRHTRY